MYWIFTYQKWTRARIHRKIDAPYNVYKVIELVTLSYNFINRKFNGYTQKECFPGSKVILVANLAFIAPIFVVFHNTKLMLRQLYDYGLKMWLGNNDIWHHPACVVFLTHHKQKRKKKGCCGNIHYLIFFLW